MRRGVARTARRGMGVLTPRQPWAWLALLVAGLTVGLFITQGRGFAAKYQAVALVCGASAAVCAGVLKYALDTPKVFRPGCFGLRSSSRLSPHWVWPWPSWYRRRGLGRSSG